MSVVSKVKKATEAVTGMFSSEEFEADAADILDMLEKEHDEMRALLADLQDTEGEADRKSLVQKIKLALIPHMKAEEKVVYGAVIALNEELAQTDGHEGHLEHEWTLKTLERLGGIADANSPEHRAASKVLMDLVEHHIQEEESNIWTDVADHFSDEDRARMGHEFQAAKKLIHIA
jgi:hypothetical protein